MKKRTTFVFALSMMLISILTINSCKKDKQVMGTDKTLFDMAKETSGFTWYKSSSAHLSKSAGSGHSQPLLRTRYNAIASEKLDSVGKIMSGATFSNGSLIVKELYDDASTFSRYAILYKSSSNANADANGWVWGYVNTDGTEAESSSNKGSACIGCHTQAGNIDYMLMDKYFP